MIFIVAGLIACVVHVVNWVLLHHTRQIVVSSIWTSRLSCSTQGQNRRWTLHHHGVIWSVLLVDWCQQILIFLNLARQLLGWRIVNSILVQRMHGLGRRWLSLIWVYSVTIWFASIDVTILNIFKICVNLTSLWLVRYQILSKLWILMMLFKRKSYVLNPIVSLLETVLLYAILSAFFRPRIWNDLLGVSVRDVLSHCMSLILVEDRHVILKIHILSLAVRWSVREWWLVYTVFIQQLLRSFETVQTAIWM